MSDSTSGDPGRGAPRNPLLTEEMLDAGVRALRDAGHLESRGEAGDVELPAAEHGAAILAITRQLAQMSSVIDRLAQRMDNEPPRPGYPAQG